MDQYRKETLLLLAFAILVIGAVFLTTGGEEFSGQGGVTATACSISSQTRVSIGDDVSTQVVASDARNAYTLLQLALDESNAVYLGFGQDAVTTGGLILDASTDRSLAVGLNSDFPFTGAINAITNTSSTTLYVTVCEY